MRACACVCVCVCVRVRVCACVCVSEGSDQEERILCSEKAMVEAKRIVWH